MKISVFDMLKIGIGPSSSHTVGPMKAAKDFIQQLYLKQIFSQNNIKTVKAELFGSLALTGKGHGTDKAVLMGLEGENPTEVAIESILPRVKEIQKTSVLTLDNKFQIPFVYKSNLLFHKKKILPYHTNGMKFTAIGLNDDILLSKNYYSVGGGFFLSEEDLLEEQKKKQEKQVREKSKYEFDSGKEMIQLCEKYDIDLKELMMRNELEHRTEQEINQQLDDIWEVMNTCIENGTKLEGQLPGPLKVQRRAHTLHSKTNNLPSNLLEYLDFVSSFALAVSEENAAGSRVVTSPTNGAAGVVPAVLKYVYTFHKNTIVKNVHRDFLLVASAIGILCKKNASISGAEGGCQAEIGTACAMASAGLCYVLGGNIYQISNSANIGLEHNLGLTCDPIFGLVQVPCIERNSMAAIKAINASNLALRGDGQHIISLDRTIRVLKSTGDQMKRQYKETALGGLAWDFYTLDDDGQKRDLKEKRFFAKNMSECQINIFINFFFNIFFILNYQSYILQIYLYPVINSLIILINCKKKFQFQNQLILFQFLFFSIYFLFRFYSLFIKFYSFLVLLNLFYDQILLAIDYKSSSNLLTKSLQTIQ